MLIPSMYFSPTQDTAWIFSVNGPANQTAVNLIGTLDGTNAIFTVPGSIIAGVSIYRNGVLQNSSTLTDPSYTLVGNTVTFNASNVPQPGDDLLCIVS